MLHPQYGTMGELSEHYLVEFMWRSRLQHNSSLRYFAALSINIQFLVKQKTVIFIVFKNTTNRH